MNLLNVISSMDPRAGGTSQVVRNSAPSLAALGTRSEVVSLDSPDAAFLGSDGFPIHALGGKGGSWCYSAALRPWLRANIGRFDALLIHGLWQYPAMAGRLEAMRAGKPYFVMPHGMLDPWFQRDPSRRIKAVRNWVYWKMIESKTLRDAEAVLFTCEDELRLAREPFRPYRLRREISVGLGIQPPPTEAPAMRGAFDARLPELPAGQPYLLFLSRLHPKKGVDLLIRAYVAVVAGGGSAGRLGVGGAVPALVIAGPLDSDYAAEMKTLAAELLPPGERRAGGPAILFPGMLAGDAKWGAFYGCEAFVLPSHQENFGIAVVEALACGKPVLISNKVNIWREIVTGGGGWADQDTADGTTRLLRRWCETPVARRAEELAHTRKVYADHFAIESATLNLHRALSPLARGVATV